MKPMTLKHWIMLITGIIFSQTALWLGCYITHPMPESHWAYYPTSMDAWSLGFTGVALTATSILSRVNW